MSTTASTSGTIPSTSLASFYECPVCFEYISPPIFQCSNGHMVCSNCSPKLDRCPSCQGPIGTSRNLFMESALSELQFPCKFSAQGCQITMLLAEKSAHEENCLLRPTPCACPFKPCKWLGNIDEIVPHFLHKHPAMKPTQDDHFILKIRVDCFHHYDSQWARLINCYDRHFLFIVEQEGKRSGDDDVDRILAAVKLIGTKSEANNYSYSLKLSGDRHRLKWEATPLSVSDDLGSAAKTHECLVLESTDFGQIFSKNDILDFDVKVERYWTEK